MKQTLDGRPGSAPCVRIPDKASLLPLLWAMTLTWGSVAAQSVPQSAPPPNSNITAPGPQRHSAPSQPQSPPAGAAAPQPIRQIAGNGTIEGFVYWDTGAVTHVPAGDCSGLAVNVAVAQSSAGPYTPLATLSNNFKYVGQVKQFLVGGKNKVYDVCTYGYGKVPVGLNLRVTVNVTSPTAFSPASVPQNSIISPINIINAQCNMLPRIVNPTAADLFSKWGTCQNMAFDVNFEITKAAESLSRSVGLQRGIGGAEAAKGPGPAGTTLLSGSGKPTLLNGPGSMPSSQPAAGTQSQASSGMLLGNSVQANSGGSSGTRQTYTGSTRGSTPGSNVELNPQPFPPKQVLTNQDVLTMLNAGLSESVILSSLRSAPHKFDFSATSCRDLQRARVTANILNAMGDGSVRPCPAITGTGALSGPGGPAKGSRQTITDITNHGPGAGLNAATATPGSNVELNPQPLPPGANRTTEPRTKLQPVKLPAPTPLEKQTNPSLAQQNASIIAVLEQQRQEAQQESGAMRATGATIASTAPARTPAVTANLQSSARVQALAPAQTQSSQGNSGTLVSNAASVNSIAHAPAFNSIVLTCSTDPTPRIVQVNGGQGHGTVFTPQSKYNLYTIIGCGFGQSRGTAHLFAPNGFTANLNIDSWSDNGIIVHLDAWLAGWLDQDNVTLIVNPVGKQLIQQQGFKFYAARGMPAPDGSDEEVQLPYGSIPQAKVSLTETTADMGAWTLKPMPLAVGYDQVPWNAVSQFSSFSFQGTAVAGWIFRYMYGHQDGDPASDCYINDSRSVDQSSAGTCPSYFSYGDYASTGGVDRWILGLAPGFSISSYQLYYESINPRTLCGAWDEGWHHDGSAGNWSYYLEPFEGSNSIDVNWPFYYCEDGEAMPPGSGRINAQYQSAYGLAVWVLGPRCIDPWTGYKDQVCVNKVKQTLG